MFELTKKDKEVEITIKYYEPIGGKPKIELYGSGDFGHHLIEGCFDLLDRLARMERVGHQSNEWKDRK